MNMNADVMLVVEVSANYIWSYYVIVYLMLYFLNK